jgi:hypothetical protein
MNGHFGVKMIIVWGKQFEKGDKESEEIVKKGRNEKRKKQKRKK